MCKLPHTAVHIPVLALASMTLSPAATEPPGLCPVTSRGTSTSRLQRGPVSAHNLLDAARPVLSADFHTDRIFGWLSDRTLFIARWGTRWTYFRADVITGEREVLSGLTERLSDFDAAGDLSPDRKWVLNSEYT